MSAEPAEREVQFVRLFLPDMVAFPGGPGQWIKSYKILDGAHFQAGLCREKTDAEIYVTPSAADLAFLAGRLGRVECDPATFEEWVHKTTGE